MMPIAWWGLLVFAGILAFESRVPVIHLGPLVVTNVELVLYLTLGLWLAGLGITRRWPTVQPACWIAGLLVAAFVLSALNAPADRAEALKFALRQIGGVALFWLAADQLVHPGRWRGLVTVLVTGITVSALAGLLEIYLPAASGWLSLFKASPTRIGAFIRASGTFEYANIAATVWEIGLLLLLAMTEPGGPVAARRSSLRAWLWLFPAFVLAQALILSQSRGALIGLAVGLAVIAGLSWRWRRPLVWRAGLMAGLTLVAFGATVPSSAAFGLRFQSENDVSWYQATLDVPSQLRLVVGDRQPVVVRLRNDSPATWPATGLQAVQLSYHWLEPGTGRIIRFEGSRSPLETALAPGQQMSVTATVDALTEPGHYGLAWDLVQTDTTWFSAKTGRQVITPVDIVAAVTGGVSPTPPAVEGPALADLISPPPSRRVLWEIAGRMFLGHPWLGIGPDNFRYRYGEYLGVAHWDTRIHANSWPLEILAGMGVVGALAWVFLLGTVVWTLWQARPHAPFYVAVVAGCLAAILGHGLLDYFLEFTPTYGLFWLVLALAVTIPGAQAKPRTADE